MSDLGGSGIVLASNSASRKAMLEAAGIAFEAEGAAVDERALEAEMEGAEPAEIAQALAAAKAAALSAARPDALVLGSDSLVEVDGRRFDKPANCDNAAEHLRFFSGKAMTSAPILRGCAFATSARTLSPPISMPNGPRCPIASACSVSRGPACNCSRALRATSSPCSACPCSKSSMRCAAKGCSLRDRLCRSDRRSDRPV